MEAMILNSQYKKVGNAQMLELPCQGVAGDSVWPDAAVRLPRKDAALLNINGIETHTDRNPYRTVLSGDPSALRIRVAATP